MSREAPSNSDDIIDSRDVIARIEELKQLREDAGDEAAGAEGEDGKDDDGTARAEAETAWDASEEGDELTALQELADEADGSADWKHGETLIRDSYFERYAQELAEDIGAIDRNANWPARCIDWEQAARELQMDYTSVDFDGVTYWIRS